MATKQLFLLKKMSLEHPRYPYILIQLSDLVLNIHEIKVLIVGNYLGQCFAMIFIITWVVFHDIINQIGTCGVVGYIWTSGDTGILEEWRQSIAPIPKEKLEELQHAVSEDDGSEDESNNPTLPDKDDSSDIAVEDDDPFSKFEKEVIYEYMIMKYILFLFPILLSILPCLGGRDIPTSSGWWC